LKRFLNHAQVRERYGGKSKMWLERKIRIDGEFPRPTKLGGRVRLWAEDELEKYERKIAARERAAAAA
jgi:predicted DNA-binding transcriptional regulator AlpA